MAAEGLAAGGFAVTVYDQMPSVGRKFLMAGRGGLNITHSENQAAFCARYGEAAERLRPLLAAFPPAALRAWCDGLGQPTFVGSSGRVFPVALKASPLLRAWLRRLGAAGVTFALRRRWTGWTAAGALRFIGPEGEESVAPDITVLALGGASWPRLGSDGGWTAALAGLGVAISPLRPANCGFDLAWSEIFRDRFAGTPLKPVRLTAGGMESRGEIVITRSGLEGGGIYALSVVLRRAIERDGHADLVLDLRPGASEEEIATRLASARGKQTLTNHLRKVLGLSPAAIGLLQEVALLQGTPLAARDELAIAALVHALPLRLTGVAPLARAISTAGGIAWDEVNADLMLNRKPGVFVAGEMLDWEAPTGGYLLQACFASGRAAAQGALRWAKARTPPAA
jgi:uncharacterized flavoprotein (TIGR03862 family)